MKYIFASFKEALGSVLPISLIVLLLSISCVSLELAPLKTSEQIMQDVNEKFGITSDANGVIVAIPTEKAYKI